MEKGTNDTGCFIWVSSRPALSPGGEIFLLPEDDQHPHIPVAERGANRRLDEGLLGGGRGPRSGDWDDEDLASSHHAILLAGPLLHRQIRRGIGGGRLQVVLFQHYVCCTGLYGGRLPAEPRKFLYAGVEFHDQQEQDTDPGKDGNSLWLEFKRTEFHGGILPPAAPARLRG